MWTTLFRRNCVLFSTVFVLSLITLLLNTHIHEKVFSYYDNFRSNLTLNFTLFGGGGGSSSNVRHFAVFKSTHDIINNHFRFSYPINVENACRHTVNRTVKIMIPVHSAVTNFKRRSLCRKGQQWNFASNRSNNALLLFFVGFPSRKLTNASMFQSALEAESRKWGDIVQINSTDTYHNLVTKAMGVLNWVITYCPESEIVLKLDDDVKISPSIMALSVYKKLSKYPDFIVGEKRVNRTPSRNIHQRWYLSKEEYPRNKFPDFVPGPAVGYPMSTVRLLYQQALRTKTVWLDDLFINGIVRERLGIPVFHDENFRVRKIHKSAKPPNFILY